MRSRRRPRAAMILGSTAETVCAKAPCTVLVTHPKEREWVSYSTCEIDLQRILVAHDFSPASTQALNYGVSLAQEYQAELHVLNVLQNHSPQEPELAWTVAGQDNYYTQTTRKLQEAIPKEVFLWSNVINAICDGSVVEAVLDYAKKREIDLICLGVTGTDWRVGKLFGSNGQRILRESPCPVLVARPDQSISERKTSGNAKTEIRGN
jgi:nucleotide-binding universal stress UspA family protein